MTSPAYAFRRTLRAPRAAYLRRRESAAPYRPWLEHFSYSRSIYAFLRARELNPDLVIDFEIDASSNVVDVGACVGDWSARVAARSGARVHAFEPNPMEFPRLHERLSAFPNVQAFECGLGAHDEKRTLTLQGPGSTVYGVSSRHDTAIVEIRDVDAVFRELRLDFIDVLKLNIEGGEFDVLERLAESGWLPRLGVVLVQFHEWMPSAHRRRRALQRTFATTHARMWDYPWVWEAWRRDRTRA